jgi:tetrahydromethanopterin S-methyltransferase subunit A
MTDNESIQTIRKELEAGIQLAKCQKCGCMHETLDNLAALLPTIGTNETQALAQSAEEWIRQMQPVQYACLGCDYCYPAVAQNAFASAFPSVGHSPALSCDFQVNNEGWPAVVGEYFVVDKTATVAVSTLASIPLAEDLAQRKPQGLTIVGKTETENIGIDKVIKNVVSSSTLRHLIVAGRDPKGHQTGNTLLALAANGVDENRRVIGASGKRPILRNVTAAEIDAFRTQVQVVDMIGCENLDEISARIEELSQQPVTACDCSECGDTSPVSISTAPKIVATEPSQVVKMDKAGYFVIVPLPDKGIITVEHYAYDNTLVRIIEGTTARALYTTIIANGWVTELSHAAYLGKELAKAELSIGLGFKYTQDGA